MKKFLPPLKTLAVLTASTLLAHLAGAASATWLAAPSNNNWIALPTTNNWSTGAGTYPGATSGTSSADIASFTNSSTVTTINCASAFVIGGITFDTTNASAYTINTSGGTWRVSLAGNANGAVIKTTPSVVNPQTITGTLRLASSGTLTVTSDSTTPSATLNITSGASGNNSGSSATLVLNGQNTGNNIFGAYTDYSTGPGTLIKSGLGTWVLTGNSTYHSNTFINGGTLVLQGSGALPNSPVITVNGGTLSVSNALVSANTMVVTNSGSLLLTNTFFRTPLTIGTLCATNATFHLGLNGSTPFTNIVVTSALNAGQNLALAIDRVSGLALATTFDLISYVGADPDAGSFTVTVPTGYTAGPVTVDTANKLVTVTVTPPSSAGSLVWTGANNSNWDTTTKNWVDAATRSSSLAYANPDTVLFDDSASRSTVTLIGTNTPFGITVNTYSLNYTFNGNGKLSGSYGLTKQGSATLTLAGTGGDDFSGGLVNSGGLLVLDNANSSISGGLTIGVGATVQVGNNDANGALPAGPVQVDGSLVFSRSDNVSVTTSISGYGSLTQSGAGTLTLSTTNSYLGSTVVNKGTLALVGAGSVSNSYTLTLSGAAFDVSGVPGTTLLQDFNIANATLNVGPTNPQPAIIATSFEVDGVVGRSNVINVLALPAVAGYPATFPLIKALYGISLGAGNFNFALGSLPAASPAYVGSLSESSDGTTVLLTLTSGPMGTRSSVTWAGINYVTASTNWSDRLNWQLPGAPGTGDNVFFDGTTTVGDNLTINNVLDTSFGIASLTYNQTSSGMWHNTFIPANQVLTVSGATGVGTGTPAGSTTSVTLSGPGEFDANGGVSVNSAGGSSDSRVTLDMSSLGTFKNLAPTTTMVLGTAAQNNVTVSLASNSVINVATLNLEATGGGNGRTGTLNLGGTTNTVWANSINISTGKGGTTKLQFGANASAGTVAIGGTGGGSARATMLLGNATSGSASCNGQLLLAGHLANVLAGTVTLGGVGGSSGNSSAGTVTFDNGSFDVTSILMGSSTSAHSSSGSFTVGGDSSHTATLTVNSVGGGSVVLGNASVSGGTGAGTLTINANGIANVNCSITKNPAAGASNTGTLNLSGGTLNMLAGTIGTAAAPIDTVNLADGSTLRLNVTAGVTNVIAAAVNASGKTTIYIDSFSGVTGTMQLPLISYNNGVSPFSGLALGSIPARYTAASLVDNLANQTIDLLVTAPPPFVWVGAVGTTLDSTWNLSTANWLVGTTPSAYADKSYVLFDDTARNNQVSLATTVSPAGITVSNNALSYTFSGAAGKISGTTGVTKLGSGTLTLAETGGDNFSGGIAVSSGTVILDNANSSISGGTTIAPGATLQVGNNDGNGVLPFGTVMMNGTLTFNQNVDQKVTNAIAGAGTLTQSGANVLTLSTSNSFTGPATVAAGSTLRLDNNYALGTSDGLTTISSGSTLDVGAPGLAANGLTVLEPITVSGAGLNNLGAIINSSTNQQYNALRFVTLAGDTTFGGPGVWNPSGGNPGRWDIRYSPTSGTNAVLSTSGNPYNLTKTGSNQVSIVGATVDPALGSIDIQQGVVGFEGGTTSMGNPASNLIVRAGATLSFYNTTSLWNKVLSLSGNGTSPTITNWAGANTVIGPVTLNGNCVFGVGGTSLTLTNNLLDGPGGLTKTGNGTLKLASTNAFAGNTTVGSGTLALLGSSSLTNSPVISIPSGATLDVSGRDGDQRLALGDGQTLLGGGTVTGNLDMGVGSTLLVGGGSGLVGTLSVSGMASLQGATYMEIGKTNTPATNDMLLVNTVVEGGALYVTNLDAVHPLVAGDTFKLFSAQTYLTSGNGFSPVVLPPLAPGLSWSNNLAVDGTLSVYATVSTVPTNLTCLVSGKQLTLSWPADHTGWRLVTNSVNVADPNYWYTFPGSTNLNQVILTVDPSQPKVFYRLVYP